MTRAITALMRLEYRKMLGQWKAVWLLGLLLLPLLPIGIVHSESKGQEPLLSVAVTFFLMYANGVCVLAALLYGSAAISSELENKTLTYLFARPIPKWVVLLGKYLGFCVCLAALAATSVTFTWLSVGKPKGGVWLWSFLKTSTLAIFAYGAVFTWIGLMVPRRAIFAGLVVALVEFITALIPSVAKQFTVTHYLRALNFADLKGFFSPFSLMSLGRDFVMGFRDFPPPRCYLTLGLITAVALASACVILHRREYNITERA